MSQLTASRDLVVLFSPTKKKTANGIMRSVMRCENWHFFAEQLLLARSSLSRLRPFSIINNKQVNKKVQ